MARWPQPTIDSREPIGHLRPGDSRTQEYQARVWLMVEVVRAERPLWAGWRCVEEAIRRIGKEG